MKNLTLTADEHLMERAREKAWAQGTTLTQAFRGEEYRAMKKRLAMPAAKAGNSPVTR
jgi:hypothetical protein